MAWSRPGLSLLRSRALQRGWTKAESVIPSRQLHHPSLGGLVLAHGPSHDRAVWDAYVGSESCDRIWCRWLLTWMMPEDCVATLGLAFQALRPGGSIALWDYFDADDCFKLSADMPTPCWNRLRDILFEEWHNRGAQIFNQLIMHV